MSQSENPANRRIVIRRIVLAAAGLVSALAAMSAMAADEGRDPPPASEPQTSQSRRIDSGYVFIDGEYLSRPYHLEETGDGVLVNGKLIKAEQFPRLGGPGGPG